MALIELPPAPDGQSYVNKVTAGGAVTVLVPTASLSEDICTATGRTWAEEARLYNIQNAPDGKQIAEPGDPFYQTAESMKNRDKELNKISAGTLKIYNSFVAEKPVATPNLSETMDKIKDGSVFSNISSGLGSIAAQTSALPGFLTASLTATQEAFAEKMTELQAKLPELQAKAATNIDILTKQKIAETGNPPSIQEIKAASGDLAIFNDAPAALKTQAENLSKSIGDAQKKFAGGLAGIGASITSFVTGVPAETIPNPIEGLPPIPNPDFLAFANNPANASKLSGLSSVTGALSGAAGKLTSLIQSAVDTSTTNLKAFGFAASLAKKVTGIAAAAQDAALDPKAFDPASITQTFGIATTLAASIDTAMYKNTKDEDLTYNGEDGLVWDRVDAERQRRNLPGLEDIGTSRPEEPPRPQYGTTPPKAEDAPKVVSGGPAGTDPDSSTKPPATKVVFEKDPDEKISKRVVGLYDRVRIIWEEHRDRLEAVSAKLPEARNTIATFFKDADEDVPAIRTAGKKVLDAKPDEATRTPEERLAVAKRRFYNDVYTLAYPYAEYVWAFNRFKEMNTQYAILYRLWEAGKTYKDVPLTVEEAIMKGTIADFEKEVPADERFNTYGEWAKVYSDRAPTSA